MIPITELASFLGHKLPLSIGDYYDNDNQCYLSLGEMVVTPPDWTVTSEYGISEIANSEPNMLITHLGIHKKRVLPVVRPITDILHELPNGRIPLIEIAEMMYPDRSNWKVVRYPHMPHTEYCVESAGEVQLDYVNVYKTPTYWVWLENLPTGIRVLTRGGENKEVKITDFQVQDYLCSKLFDIHKWIDRRVAVNINEVKLIQPKLHDR